MAAAQEGITGYSPRVPLLLKGAGIYYRLLKEREKNSW